MAQRRQSCGSSRRARLRNSPVFDGVQRARGRRVTDATNGFRILKTSILLNPRLRIDQAWYRSHDLEPYVLYKAIAAATR